MKYVEKLVLGAKKQSLRVKKWGLAFLQAGGHRFESYSSHNIKPYDKTSYRAFLV